MQSTPSPFIPSHLSFRDRFRKANVLTVSLHIFVTTLLVHQVFPPLLLSTPTD